MIIFRNIAGLKIFDDAVWEWVLHSEKSVRYWLIPIFMKLVQNSP
jgi:hypothetical protein